MDSGVSVFGKPATKSIADQVLASPSMNTSPSPSEPAHVPADALVKRYAQLHAIASSALNEEQDDRKRAELERIVAFADQSLTEAVSVSGSQGAPVPNLPMPPPPPPQAPPMGMGMPQAAPGGPAPAGIPAPTSPGVVPA
jgi:hypothetical protein